jgi:large conductance mechanosensitive channel
MKTKIRKFTLKGPVVFVTAGVVLGGAMTSIITVVSKGILMPLIGAALGQPDFAASQITWNGARFPVGELCTTGVTAAVAGLAVYLVLVRPFHSISESFEQDTDPSDGTTPVNQ